MPSLLHCCLSRALEKGQGEMDSVVSGDSYPEGQGSWVPLDLAHAEREGRGLRPGRIFSQFIARRSNGMSKKLLCYEFVSC